MESSLRESAHPSAARNPAEWQTPFCQTAHRKTWWLGHDPVMSPERRKTAHEDNAIEVRVAGLLGESSITRSAALQLQNQV
jgi:hypothetical protein